MNSLLIVTAESGLAASIKRLLADDYHVFHVEDGMEAVERVERTDFDAVLLDAPVKGFETAGLVGRLLRAREGLPVCVLAHNVNSESSLDAMRAGAHRLAPKPFDADNLLYTLSSAISTYRKSARPGAAVRETRPAGAEPASNGADAEDPVGRLAQTLMELRSEGSALECALHAAAGPLAVARAAVCVRAPGQTAFYPAARLGPGEPAGGEIRFGLQSALVRWLIANERIFARGETGAEGDPRRTEAERELALLGAEVAAPLSGRNGLIGFIALGPSAIGRAWRERELKFLAAVCRIASGAVDTLREIQRLRESEAFWRVAFQSLPAAAVLIDSEGQTIALNEAAARLFDRDALSLAGQPVEKLDSMTADFVRRALDGAAPEKPETARIAASGKIVRMAARRAALDSSGKPGVVLSLNGDSGLSDGERRRLLDEREGAWLRGADRISQEIKNPLVAIQTFTQLLAEKYKEEDFRTEFQAIVGQEARSLDGLAERLLVFSQTGDAGKTPFDLNAAAREEIKTAETSLKGKTVRFRRQIHEFPISVRGDERLTRLALSEILKNAFEAAPDGGEATVRTDVVSLKIGGAAFPGATMEKQSVLPEEIFGRNFALIEIADNGPGMTVDPESAVQPFVSTKIKGLGLGLAIARNLIQSQNGRLSVVSEKGKGCKVSIHLPLE